MRVLGLFLLVVPVTRVSACEGDCIVGITNAWLSNYTSPVHAVIDSIAHQISDLIPSHPSLSTSRSYLEPILSAYHKKAYGGMEAAIFPHYFHGKCLDAAGNEPAGCPNPDCPIVCGTPGSLVHFFPKLRYIAFNQTYHLLKTLSTPGTPTYAAVEKAVLAASDSPSAADSDLAVARALLGERRRAARLSRVFSARTTEGDLPADDGSSGAVALASGYSQSGNGLALVSGTEALTKRTPDVKAGLASIMEQLQALLGTTCGGNGEEATNGLPFCSWEGAMKEYILTFP